jgi:hypothetical protein
MSRVQHHFTPFLDMVCAAHIRQCRETRTLVIVGKITVSEFARRREIQNKNFHARYDKYMRLAFPGRYK